MSKNYLFCIDDVIWLFRDLTREQPCSLFDNEFLKVLKNAHDDFGLRLQLNCFYRTDFFYGDDEFTLADMTDRYREEWEQCSDWLKLAFHAKQEFPDYPYINATYETVKNNFEAVKNEIVRFAGEKTFISVVNPHWLPVSFEGCRALYDCGVRIIGATNGIVLKDESDIDKLPYGHIGRMKQNRQPETGLFVRNNADEALAISLKGYNHLDVEADKKILYKNDFCTDKKTGLKFKRFCNTCCLDVNTIDEVKNLLKDALGKEYIGCLTHEQYFHRDYFAYQPEYASKINYLAEFFQKNGYKSIFLNEI